jgi:predicted  nucleic acid-binding Zn-ribbon protein
MSFGGGYGYGRRFISPKNELAALEDEKEALKKELEEINNEIADLKKQDK